MVCMQAADRQEAAVKKTAKAVKKLTASHLEKGSSYKVQGVFVSAVVCAHTGDHIP
jgi:hypothetical protein